jgi:hypothetical protein
MGFLAWAVRYQADLLVTYPISYVIGPVDIGFSAEISAKQGLGLDQILDRVDEQLDLPGCVHESLLISSEPGTQATR